MTDRAWLLSVCPADDRALDRDPVDRVVAVVLLRETVGTGGAGSEGLRELWCEDVAEDDALDRSVVGVWLELFDGPF